MRIPFNKNRGLKCHRRTVIARETSVWFGVLELTATATELKFSRNLAMVVLLSGWLLNEPLNLVQDSLRRPYRIGYRSRGAMIGNMGKTGGIK